MILEFCREHRVVLRQEASAEAVEANRLALRRLVIPFALEPRVIQAALWSRVAGLVMDGHRVFDGLEIATLHALPTPHPADHARLVSKGRLLYEHCMFEISSTCIVGFIEHELRKSRDATVIMLDLLGWIAEQRIQMAKLDSDDPEDEVEGRLEHTDYMIEMGMSFVHGLDRERARALARDKEP